MVAPRPKNTGLSTNKDCASHDGDAGSDGDDDDDVMM